MDKKLKNSKGFTLIELIGIIIILALIALITYPIIGNIVDKVNRTVCDLNSYAVAEAAENYMVKEGKKLPDNGIFNVPLKILRENNLVSKILDPLDKKIECDGYAVIQRKERGFEIDGHVICPNYCNSDEYVSDDNDNKLGVGEYYVGANPNNWVMFGRYHQSSVYGILWRMVKTDEGGIKLIFEGVENGGNIPLEDGRTLHGSTAGVQYDKNSTNPFDKSTLNIKLNNWLDNLVVINKYDYVKKTNWKIGGIPFYNPTFKDTFIEFEGIDSETNYGKYRGLSELSGIGLLNPSDFIHTSSNTACTSSYKTGGSSNPCAFNEEEKNNFLYKNKYHYWTMNASSDTANKAWYINNIGQITTGMTNSSVISVRPVINLDSDTVFISGSGTIDDPYIIEDYMVDIKNKPLITLNGQEKIVLREGDSYTELGAIAEDPEDGDISNKIVISSDLNVSIPGTYKIEYNVKDSDGNNAPTVIRTVVVSPKESPIITIIGDNPLKITLKNSYVELGATASDPFYGDISGDIVIAGEVNTNELGIYEITYSVTNKDGLEAIPVIRKVIVEPSRPVIKLNGESPTNVYVGSSYIEEGATAFDSVDGDITNQIEKEITRYETVKSGNGYKTKDSIVSEVIVEKKYRYRIVYKVTNTYGVTSSVTRSINILPDDGPEIAFEPEKSTTAKKSHGVKVTVTKRQYDVDPSSVKYMWINSKWEMPRNTTLENLIRTSFKSGSTLTISGRTELYKLYVIAKDIHGNTTIKSTGYFRLDNSIPVIRLNGSNPYRILIGKTYQEFGATAYDEYYSGNLTSRIEIDSSSVDTNKEGTYYVSYSVKDNAENERIVYRRVEVYLSKPKITLNGSAHEKIVLGRQYIEKGATAIDEKDGNITNKINVSGSVDTSKVGTYDVTYSVTNSLGVTTTMTRKVEVYIPNPIITIIGDNPLKHRILLPYKELGATAYDEIDGDITDKLQVVSTVNTDVKGKYEVEYSVTNSHGKVTTVKRIVDVFAPKPEITLNGDEFVKIFKDDIYIELGATAYDEIDGDLTGSIRIIGEVNPTTIDSYKLKYEVTNSFEETSYKIRTVQVNNPEVTIELIGKNPHDMYVGSIYKEPGFAAIHETLGDVSDRIIVKTNLNPNIVGKYTVSYSYEDDSVSEPIIVERKVNVLDTNLTLTLLGDNPYNMTIGDEYEEPGYTATDDVDGDLTEEVIITQTKEIDNLTVGTYYLDYKITNSIGKTIQDLRTIQVLPPGVDLKLNGADTIEIFVGDGYQELGAIAFDEVDGDISDKIVITSNLNTNIVGEYIIEYKVVSDYGVEKIITRTIKVSKQEGPNVTFEPDGSSVYHKNYSVKVTVSENKGALDIESFKYLWSKSITKPSETSFQKVLVNGNSVSTPEGENGNYYLWVMAKDVYGNTTIKASMRYLLDNTPPVIKLNGKNVIEIPADSTYKELGATVTELHSGLNEDGLKITSNLVPGLLGTYTITYEATDKVGLRAETIVRTVNVVEASLKDAPDDSFVPKYYAEYFIGENPNNWVAFGSAVDNEYDYIPLLWRIIKADDEGIKIVYEGVKNGTNLPIENGKIGNAIFDETSSDYNSSTIRVFLDNWYNNITEPQKTVLTSPINWCIGSINTPYSIDDFKNDECKIKTTIKSAIGLINSGDYLLTSENACGAYNQTNCGTKNFLNKNYDYMTINRDKVTEGYIFSVESNGALRRSEVSKVQGLRPVINLRPDILILGGDGTLNNPYRLNSREAVEDTFAPNITFNPSTANGSIENNKVQIIVTDDITGVDPNTLKYVWTTSSVQPSVEVINNTFNNGDLIDIPNVETNTYYLWVIAKDRKGNQSIVSGGPYTIDNSAPVITINGSNPYFVAKGAIYKDLGATATDNVDPYVKVNVSSNVNPSFVGTYTVTYTATDKAGNTTTATRTIQVIDVGDEFNPDQGINHPVLATGMTPIRWVDTTEMITTQYDASWYNYDDKKWANAKTEDGSYWVWIPRFAYRISTNYHTKTQGNIDIKFLLNNTNIAKDGTNADTVPKYSGSSQTNYIVHPAFVYGDQQLTGIWVAKFEGSGTTNNISFIPNATSLDNSINNHFMTSYNVRNNNKYGWKLGEIDSHLIKNSEWGAVAYLAESIYGKTTEVWINNSSTYITGCVGSSASAGSYSGCQNKYNTSVGNNGSTTGNIYGIYDMSGGRYEFTASYVNNNNANLNNYGASIIGAKAKYKDIYTITSDSTSANYSNSISKYGTAIYETSNTYNSNSGSWYNDQSYMPYSSSPWFIRGGVSSGTTSAGIFAFNRSNGSATGANRTVIVPIDGPKITITPNGISTQGTNVRISVSSNKGVNQSTLKYAWTTNTGILNENDITEPFSNNGLVKTPNENGARYYLWVIGGDNQGNVTVSRSGEFIIDTEAPVITLNGEPIYKHRLGDIYSDAGVVVTDNTDPDVKVTIDSNFNPSIRGTYQIIYTATDRAGNSASVTRTVIVDVKEIRTPEDLYNIRNDVEADYILMNNIDMSNSAYAENFPAITDFYGTLDGKGYKILNLKVNASGIFTNIHSGAEIYNIEFINFENNNNTNYTGTITGTISEPNIKLEDIKIRGLSRIKGTNYVGGLVGRITSNLDVKNIQIDAFINGSDYIGGVIGHVTTMTVRNSTSSGRVEGRNYIGGLIGYISSSSSIINDYTSSDISGTSYIGGLIGIHNSGTITITSSYATGNVTGTNYYVGGLAGRIYSASINYAYASGDVEGLDSVGGLFGYTRGGSVSKSYASGNVKSSTTTSSTGHGTGGLIGYNRSTLYDTFSAGTVTRGGTNGYIGGLVGYNYSGSINRSYVLGKLTGAQAFVGAINSLTATNTYFIGETTGIYSGSYATMISSVQEATDSSKYAGFNFDTIWGIEYGETTPYIKGLMIPEQNYLSSRTNYTGEGSGTIENPYLVKTAEDLNNIRNSLGLHYKLANDIDMSTSSYAENFPIIIGFNGSLDGNGKTIKNLKMTRGLFRSYDNMTVKNLTLENVVVNNTSTYAGAIVDTGVTVTLENVHITGTSSITSSVDQVGGLVGRATTLTINNSSSNAVVTGKNYIGGLAGYIYSTSSIKNSYANGNVSGTSNIGGLIGRHNSGTITISSSYATGNVTGTNYYVGGLAGYIYSSNVSYAYASGDVEGLDSVGGLFGNTRGGSVSKSYASGNVKSSTTTSSTGHGTGGLIGYNRSTLYDAFSAGTVTRGGTAGYIGGLVGYNYTGSINRSYVLGKLTNASAFVGAINSLSTTNTYFIGETTGVVSGSYVTKIESKIEATYSSRYEGFNFDTIWGIEYGATTPYLRGLTIPEEVYIIE